MGASLPAPFTVRRPAWDDLDAVVALYNAIAEARVGEPLHDADEVRLRWLTYGRFDDALVVELDHRVVGYCEFEEDLDPFTGELDLYFDGRVHPDVWGQGLASFFISRAEARAGRAVDAHPEAPRVALRTTVANANDQARALFERRGYRPTRHLLRMRFDLREQQLPAEVPLGITLTRFRRGRDERRVWATVHEAFEDHHDFLPLPFPDWVAWRIERDGDFDPDLWLIAEDGDQIAGVALCRVGAPEDPTLGTIVDLGVRPAWRRQGVAFALLREAFAEFRSRGVRRVGLEVDDVTLGGAVRLYEQAGMRAVRRTDVYEKVLRADSPGDDGD